MHKALIPAKELAERNRTRFPNESEDYRRARTALLAEEIELRQLPPGGAVTRDYYFEGEHGRVSLADLFGSKETLVVYSYMFGPQRERPCPMCTSFMSSWAEKVPDIEQRVGFAMVARSPIDRLVAAKKARGWTKLKVFTRKGGTIHHFWSNEMGAETADPGQDPRGAPDFDPLWTILDTTPEGRGADWYPKLEYGKAE
jgi:predicted dithiol-disulfide oxidoreductase (DUF899 family)